MAFRTRRAAFLAVAVAAQFAAGCSEDRDSTASVPGPAVGWRDGEASIEEFVTEADAVCARNESRMAAAFSTLRAPDSDLASFSASLTSAGTAVRTLSAELDAVPLPRGNLGAEAYVTSIAASADLIAQAREAAAASDQAGVQEAITQLGVIADDAVRLGRKLGFEECGKATR